MYTSGKESPDYISTTYDIYRSISNQEVHKDLKSYIEEMSINLGWIEITDLFFDPKYYMKYMSLIRLCNRNIITPLYTYLRYRGIDDIPFRTYISKDAISEDFKKNYPKFWREFLVYAIRNNNPDLTNRIITQHRKQMNQASIDYMYKLVYEDKYNKIENKNFMISIINRSLS